MTAEHMAWALQAPVKAPMDRLVLVVLASRATEDGRLPSEVSLEEVTEAALTYPGRVSSALAALHAAGHLTTDEHGPRLAVDR